MNKKGMNKSDLIAPPVRSRKVAVVTACVVIFLVVLDLLMTRQIVPYNNTSETVIFILTVIVAYGVGSWILLGYTKQAISGLRAKSRFINIMYWAVTIIQFCLLAILVFVIFDHSSRFPVLSVYLISSISALIIIGIISFKFFSWYSRGKRNVMVLFFGIATATFGFSILEDAYTKIILVQVVEEKSPPGAIPQSSFLYKTVEKYHAEVEYKVVNPQTTTLWIVPTSQLALDNELNYLTVFPYLFTWLAVATLLRQYYRTIRIGKLPLKFWIALSIPMALYLIGSGLIFHAYDPYRFYFRILFRAGTIGSSVLFGLAFYLITRRAGEGLNVSAEKVKDYLTISSIGVILIGISFSTSALQQTYGVAAHSLILLASYLFTVGLYSSAIAVSQDSSLRTSIRASLLELVDNIGTAQMEQEIEKRVLKVAREQQEVLRESSGIESSLTEKDMREYLEQVIEEVKKQRPSP
jgi:hypothetical protein